MATKDRLTALIKETESALQQEIDTYNKIVQDYQQIEQMIQNKRVYIQILEDRFKTYSALLDEEAISSELVEVNGEVIARAK